MMALLENQLAIKRSTLPGAGKGLFTKRFIPKGSHIVEYKGRIKTWREVSHSDFSNGYIFYVKRNHVINASPYKRALARFANDAGGLMRVKGINNNAYYGQERLRVFIIAKRDILPDEEILVDYGKEYWQAIRHNRRIDRMNG